MILFVWEDVGTLVPASSSHVDQQTVSSVATGASGIVIITGQFFGTVDLGGGVLTSAGSIDIFVAKFKL